MPHPLAPEPEGIPLLITAASAQAAGMSPATIAHRVETGRWQAIRHGVFLRVGSVFADEFEAKRALHANLATATAMRNPGSVIVRESAAILHGAPLITPIPSLPQLVLRRGHGAARAGAKFREFALDPNDVLDIGVQLTTALRTWTDIARTGRVRDAVAVGDYFARLGTVDTQVMRDYARTARGRNCRVMRRAAAMVNGLRESPLESWSAVKFDEWGLPGPEWQVDIVDERGEFVGRVDALWKHARVIGEADGAGKYTDRAVLVAEKRREDRLRALGFTVIRWTWQDLATGSGRLEAQLRQALAHRADP